MVAPQILSLLLGAGYFPILHPLMPDTPDFENVAAPLGNDRYVVTMED